MLAHRFREDVRILVVHMGALGDFLLALPALSALRRRFPRAYIELLGRPSIHGIAERRGPVDRVVCGEALGWHRLFAGDVPDDLAAYLTRFDLILSWFGFGDESYRRALTSLATASAEGVRVLIARSIPPPARRVHVADYLLETLAPLGIELSERPAEAAGGEPNDSMRVPRVNLLAEDHQEAQRILRALGLEGCAPVAVHPGSGSPRKCWPAERFAQLIRQFERWGLAVLLIEGPADREAVERVLASCGTRGEMPHRLARVRDLPLPHLAALLQQCRLFVGNDSGITHLAAAVGTPVLALFRTTDPERWGPRGHVTLMRGDVSVEEVVRESERILSEVRPTDESKASGSPSQSGSR